MHHTAKTSKIHRKSFQYLSERLHKFDIGSLFRNGINHFIYMLRLFLKFIDIMNSNLLYKKSPKSRCWLQLNIVWTMNNYKRCKARLLFGGYKRNKHLWIEPNILALEITSKLQLYNDNVSANKSRQTLNISSAILSDKVLIHRGITNQHVNAVVCT